MYTLLKALKKPNIKNMSPFCQRFYKDLDKIDNKTIYYCRNSSSEQRYYISILSQEEANSITDEAETFFKRLKGYGLPRISFIIISKEQVIEIKELNHLIPSLASVQGCIRKQYDESYEISFYEEWDKKIPLNSTEIYYLNAKINSKIEQYIIEQKRERENDVIQEEGEEGKRRNRRFY